jgi:hypothetical protein
MSWREYHEISSIYVRLAETLARGGDVGADLQQLEQENPALLVEIDRSQNRVDLMKQFYRQAAKAEEQAIDALDPSKQKTLGITAVSAASLWLKARDFREVQRVCDRWIKAAQEGKFPGFAEADLENLLKIIQSRFDLRPEDLFCPGRPIKHDRQELFVGRRKEMSEAVKNIDAGFSLVIAGEAGVGKTSFAWQLMELLSGEPETCDRWLWSPDRPYRCVWLDCNTTMKTLEDVLINLLQPSCRNYTFFRHFPTIYASPYKNSSLEEEIDEQYSIYLKLGRKTENKLHISIRELFQHILEKIAGEYPHQPVIIILDSLDAVETLRPFKEFIETTRELVQYILLGTDGCLTRFDVNPPRMELVQEVRINRWSSEDIKLLFSAVEEIFFHTVVFEEDLIGLIAKESHSIADRVHQLACEVVKEAFNQDMSNIPLTVGQKNLKHTLKNGSLKRTVRERTPDITDQKQVLHLDKVARRQISQKSS